MRQQGRGRGVLLINGAPPAPSTQRLHAQAVRDEVEARLSDMMATAEAMTIRRAAEASDNQRRQQHLDAGTGTTTQQRSAFLPSITATSHIPQPQNTISGTIVPSSSSSSASNSHQVPSPDQVIFSVQGTPQSVLRDCIKHFLTHPDIYGPQVHALLQDELGYILSLWATSPIGAGGSTSGHGAASADHPTSAGDRTIGQNFVEDNFFDRLIREETTRRQQQHQAKQKQRLLLQNSGGRKGGDGTLDYDDEAFLAVKSSSPLLPAIAPRPPPIDTKGLTSPHKNTSSALLGNSALAVSIVEPAAARHNAAAASQRDPAGADLAMLGSYEVNTLRRQIKALNQTNAVLAEQLNTKRLEFHDKDNELMDAETTIEELEGAVVAAKRGKEALELQLQDLKGSLDDQLLKVTSFRDEEEDKRRTTEARLLEVRSELGQVYTQWKTTQNQLAASQKELDRSVEECEQLHNNLTTAKARLVHAHKVVARRNRTIVLMQELLLQRREMHGKLAQCVKELEVFAGSGTLTELYLAADPAWASFLFYRLHRHVFHVSANVSVTSTIPNGTPLSVDAPMFGATSEGGSWRASSFSTELLYRLLLSNNGEYQLIKDDKQKPGGSGITATPRARRSFPNSIASDGDGDDGGGDSPMGGKARFKLGLGACKTLQWGESAFQIHFEFQSPPPAAAQEASLGETGDFGVSLSNLDDTLVALGGSSKFPTFGKQRISGAEFAVKCRPVLTIEALLIPPPFPIVRRLNVPATILAAQHKRALAANDLGAVDLFASLLPPPYDQKFESVDDTMKLRRSDVRLILYALWKERYQQYVEFFQATRLAKATPTARSFASEGAPPPPTPEPMASFMTFVYRFFSARFPITAPAAGSKKASTSAASGGAYTNPIDISSVVVRSAVAEDRVAYCYLRSKAPESGQPGIADAPLGGKYLSRAGAASLATSATVDSIVQLSLPAKEALLALIHYAYEYKEVDADFRMFYLVSHQLLPEAAAINFYAMMESIYRDCDDSVLRYAAEGIIGKKSQAPRRRGPSSTPQDSTAEWAPRLPSVANSMNTNNNSNMHSNSGGGGPFKELYQELPTTKVEMRTVNVSQQNNMTFDEQSSSEDDDASIIADVGNPMLASSMLNINERSLGDLSQPSLFGGGTPAASRQTPKHVLVGAQPKRFHGAPQVARGRAGTNIDSSSSNKLQSTVLHRNGIVSLHDFLAIIEKNCFATFQLVKETSSSAASHEDTNLGDDGDGDEAGGHSGSLATPRALVTPRAMSEGDGDAEDEFADLIRTYREEARMRLEEEASDASPLCRIGFVPLSPVQAQRLKFALSLDQPSSVVKYASLFRPDHGAARPSHFYDELLTMVLDHHLAIQEVLMEELITPACRCRAGGKRPNPIVVTAGDGTSTTKATTQGIDGSTVDESYAASPMCDGEISVQRLLTHTIRWVSSLQGAALGGGQPVPQAVPPPPPPTGVLGRFANQSLSMEDPDGKSSADLTPPRAAIPIPEASAQDAALPFGGSSGAAPPLAIDIAARRFVLQLCEACPPDNTSGQFVDSILTVTSLTKAAQYEATHPQLSALLDNFLTLPLHHLAAKIRTTLIIFEGEQLDAAGGSGSGHFTNGVAGGRRSSRSRASYSSKRDSSSIAPGDSRAMKQQRQGGAKSSLAFVPPSREMLAAFRQEMDAACWECERRITLQRGLHNDLLFVLPSSHHGGQQVLSGGTAKQQLQALVTSGGASGADSNNKKGSRGSTVHRTAIAFEDIVDAALAGSSPTPRHSQQQQPPGSATGGGTLATTMSFRSFYEDDAAATATSTTKASSRGKFAAAAAASTGAAGPTRGRSKSISDAVRQAFDAARFASSDRSLTQLQEQKQIPLEISLSSMLRRQLAPQFPVALLPPLGDLAVYHKALMVALLKPMDDNAAAAAAAAAVPSDGLSATGGQLGRRASVLSSEPPPMPSPGTRPISLMLGAGSSDGTAGRGRMRMIATRATSFAFSQDADPLDRTADVDNSGNHQPPSDRGGDGGATGFRRRLGSVAMGIYSSLT